MCSVDAPPPVEIEKPTFVRNPFLDENTADERTADALRRGRSSLVIPKGTGIGFEGRGGSTGGSTGGNPNANARGPLGGNGGGRGGNPNYQNFTGPGDGGRRGGGGRK